MVGAGWAALLGEPLHAATMMAVATMEGERTLGATSDAVRSHLREPGADRDVGCGPYRRCHGAMFARAAPSEVQAGLIHQLLTEEPSQRWRPQSHSTHLTRQTRGSSFQASERHLDDIFDLLPRVLRKWVQWQKAVADQCRKKDNSHSLGLDVRTDSSESLLQFEV